MPFYAPARSRKTTAWSFAFPTHSACVDPVTSEFLRPRHGADRLNSDGSEQSKARSLYDLTFSAPKSVSIQALVGGDGHLIAAHDKAVREALAEAESYAATRVRLNGANENRTTGNWIAASYRHDTSRELDPQLHTHAVAANLTYDSAEGRWKALQASGLYERRAYLTEVYRNALAGEVRSLGYEIEPRRDSRGRDTVFAGVDPACLSVYTKRVFKRLGIPDASFHTLRHTAASWLVMQGVGLYTVGQILGHKTPRMTQRYAHLSPDYMAGAVDKLDGIMGGMLPATCAPEANSQTEQAA